MTVGGFSAPPNTSHSVSDTAVFFSSVNPCSATMWMSIVACCNTQFWRFVATQRLWQSAAAKQMAQLLAFEFGKFMKDNVAMRVRQRKHWFALVVQRDIV